MARKTSTRMVDLSFLVVNNKIAYILVWKLFHFASTVRDQDYMPWLSFHMLAILSRSAVKVTAGSVKPKLQ